MHARRRAAGGAAVAALVAHRLAPAADWAAARRARRSIQSSPAVRVVPPPGARVAPGRIPGSLGPPSLTGDQRRPTGHPRVQGDPHDRSARGPRTRLRLRGTNGERDILIVLRGPVPRFDESGHLIWPHRGRLNWPHPLPAADLRPRPPFLEGALRGLENLVPVASPRLGAKLDRKPQDVLDCDPASGGQVRVLKVLEAELGSRTQV